MAVQRRRVAWILLFVVGATLQSCQSPSADAPPTAPPNAPAFAKATAGPTVTAANPAAARQGTVTLDVQITGSGFDQGSRASWQLNGAAYPKIAVNKTQFVSSTSLIANITVAQDAAVVTYDIAVTTSTGKKGIGAEMFTVTYAVPISGMTEGHAINDAGQIIGYNGTAIVLSDPNLGIVPVASGGLVYDIDRNGRTVVGKDTDGYPVIWTSPAGPGGPWTAARLPSLGADGTVRGIASDAAGDAVLLSGATLLPNAPRTPTVWTRTATGWQPRYFAIPAGVVSAWGQAINVRGQVAGMDGSTCCFAIYWDSLGTPTVLGRLGAARNASAWSINGDGTIIVGGSGASAVYWRRTLVAGSYGPWSGAIALENTGANCGKNGSSLAYDVNAAGTMVVGMSCGVATAWRLSGGVVTSRVVLQGLGPPNQSVAYGVNDLPAPQAVGQAKTSSGTMFFGF
jgi:uncharacterized membrane protein